MGFFRRIDDFITDFLFFLIDCAFYGILLVVLAFIAICLWQYEEVKTVVAFIIIFSPIAAVIALAAWRPWINNANK